MEEKHKPELPTTTLPSYTLQKGQDVSIRINQLNDNRHHDQRVSKSYKKKIFLVLTCSILVFLLQSFIIKTQFSEWDRVRDYDDDISTSPLPVRVGQTEQDWEGGGEGRNGGVPRIAIIGAGAGGSSCAYFLKHFSTSLTSRNLSTELTIFESSDYIGGRSTLLWPWNQQDPYSPPPPPPPLSSLISEEEEEEEEEVEPIELGASIFVEANKNLQKAVKEFGLETTKYGEQENGETGIWDGEKFVFKESGRGWWDKTKLLWRYGRSPFKVKSLVKTTVDSFLNLYDRTFITSTSFPFSSIYNFSISLPGSQLLISSSISGSEYFEKESISPLFTNELISAATQVNYGSSIDEIHGLGALVSLAANGAVSVKGGNRQIFEQFVERSKAELRLNTRVNQVIKLDPEREGGRSKWLVKTEQGQGGVYDAVILAAPYHQSSISFPQLSSSSLPPSQPYVNLHVTIVLTNSTTPLSSYFSLPTKATVPNSIFSTFTTPSTSKPKFNSLNYLKSLPRSISQQFDPCTNSTVHVVKLFSKETLNEIELEGLFGKGNVLGKKIEKIWKAYPRLEPITNEKDLARVVLDRDGLYYVNSMERLISTMETETVSAYNVIALIMKDFFNFKPWASWAEWPERRRRPT
ncbi:hypothetical protein JCM3765_006303 [Sporobolomyces pararoseus]